MATKENKVDSVDVIEAYREASAKLLKVRRTIVGLVLFVILANLSVIYFASKSFIRDGLPQLAANLHAATTPVLAEHGDEVSQAFGRVSQAYIQALTDVYVKDEEKIQQVMESEGEKLENYVQSRWPEFEKAIANMAISQEDVIKTEVAKLVGEEGVTQVSLNYQEALVKQLESAVGDRLQLHVDISGELREKFSKLVQREPEVARNASVNQALGLVLELVGIELQTSSEELANASKPNVF